LSIQSEFRLLVFEILLSGPVPMIVKLGSNCHFCKSFSACKNKSGPFVGDDANEDNVFVASNARY